MRDDTILADVDATAAWERHRAEIGPDDRPTRAELADDRWFPIGYPGPDAWGVVQCQKCGREQRLGWHAGDPISTCCLAPATVIDPPAWMRATAAVTRG